MTVGELKRLAYAELRGVGDQAAEWTEWTGYAYHLRRRLTPAEQSRVGDAVDLRGTAEGLVRFKAIAGVINERCLEFAREELSAE